MVSVFTMAILAASLALTAYLFFRHSIRSFFVWWFGVSVYMTAEPLQISKTYFHSEKEQDNALDTLDSHSDITKLDQNTTVLKKKISLREIITKACPSIITPKGEPAMFIPSLQLFNSHLQTLYNSYLAVKRAPVPEVEYDREVFTNEDGSTFALDWSPPFSKVPPNNRPVVVMVSGIAGGSHEYYVKACAKVLISEPYNYRVLVINYRGCSRTPLTTTILAHGGFTTDIRTAINYAKKKLHGSLMFGIGFSIGANVLTKYVGEEGSNCPLTACASICNPFDFKIAEVKNSKNKFMYKYVYNPYLTKALINVADKNKHILNLGDHAKTISDIDDIVSESHNFESREEYYAKASSKPYLKKIAIPILCLNSIDDPVCPSEAVEKEYYKLNPYLVLVRTYFGGHLGFFNGLKPNPWHPEPVAEFFKAIEQS
ncbi:hypothetical protein BB561_000561 [Smittium simulii]|uniref:AB hydrolase-1 domain-containing protein n=1 Tax=Smittium simulii TaxID=133385 RepID=A0A2T9YYN9_9FUNG|nr:hypothetical protein BB561_000561 [Smittium simulii]